LFVKDQSTGAILLIFCFELGAGFGVSNGTDSNAFFLLVASFSDAILPRAAWPFNAQVAAKISS
jgi:hypothetical protein